MVTKIITEEGEVKKVYVCPYCGKTFITQQGYAGHIKKHKKRKRQKTKVSQVQQQYQSAPNIVSQPLYQQTQLYYQSPIVPSYPYYYQFQSLYQPRYHQSQDQQKQNTPRWAWFLLGVAVGGAIGGLIVYLRK